MSAVQHLVSFHIIETDADNQMLVSWTYPSLSNRLMARMLEKASQELYKAQSFYYCRFKHNWLYFANADGGDRLRRVKAFTLVLIARDFHPDKYEQLAHVLTECYCRTGTPVELVKLFLAVQTTGRCSSSHENGTFVLRAFDKFSNTKLKELISMFGLEIILLYTAMLLKRKVIVYHHSPQILLQWLPSICALMVHRDPNQYLFPLLEMNTDTFIDLKKTDFFVAGFKDASIFERDEYYDVFVNLPAREMTISARAKEYMTMTKTHKDIAVFLVQLAENDSLSEPQLIDEITHKTNELLSFLKGLGGHANGTVTMEDLKSRSLHPALENFLFHLAVAENIMIF